MKATCECCGKAYDWQITYSDGQVGYFFESTRQRYLALYGKMQGQITRVSK